MKRKDGKLNRISDYLALPVDELADIIEEKNKKVIFLGDGVENHRDFFKNRLKDSCEFAPGSMRLQRGIFYCPNCLYEGKRRENRVFL